MNALELISQVPRHVIFPQSYLLKLCEEVLPSTSTSSVSLREAHCHSFRIISCLVEMIWSVPGSCCGIKAMIVLIGPSKQLGTPNAKPNHHSREEVGIRIEVLSQR